ncbi:hypothetical protein [Oceanimonas smirnovii]|uniref:hypothetical protein n=1 Tax=Oceanimonas smirnovii TaxID=264574 RepID=UPI0012EAE227|nr:hypothetical protein [Oceanimonas smirnovii]
MILTTTVIIKKRAVWLVFCLNRYLFNSQQRYVSSDANSTGFPPSQEGLSKKYHQLTGGRRTKRAIACHPTDEKKNNA